MPSGRAQIFPALLRFVQDERWGRSPARRRRATRAKLVCFGFAETGCAPAPLPLKSGTEKNRPCVYRVLSAVIEVLNKKLIVANAECNGQGFYFIGIEMALTNLDFG